MLTYLRARAGRLGRAGACLLLVFGLAGALEPIIQAVTSTAASAQTCSSGGFSEDFEPDDGFDSACWSTGTTLLSTVANAIGNEGGYGNLTSETPTFDFPSDMDIQGANSEGTFTGIQSVDSYSAPFDFDTSVEAPNASNVHGNPFLVSIVNGAGTEGFTVDGNPDSANKGYYGLWASNKIGAASGDTPALSPNTPSAGVVYDISMSIDATGDATVSVGYSGGATTTVSVGNVGTTGPFYVVLGQWEGNPTVGPGTNEAAWYSASLNLPCGSSTSFSDDFANDNSLSSCWQASTPMNISTSPTVTTPQMTAVETALGDTDYPINESGPAGDFDAGMLMNGPYVGEPVGNNSFGAIQSTSAYSAPFEFQTSVQAYQGSASVFAIYLVNANATEAFAVEGDPDPSTPGTGLWANNALPAASGNGSKSLLSSLKYQSGAYNVNTTSMGTYNISMSIDASGNGSVSVNGGPVVSVGNVGGTGPFYVLLGQRVATNQDTNIANEATWLTASLGSTCGTPDSDSFTDNFGSDSALSSCWQAPSSSDATTPVVLNYTQDTGSANGPFNPSFSTGAGGYMLTTGADSDNDWNGMQSSLAYSAPFTFTTTAAGVQSNGDTIGVYLVSASGLAAPQDDYPATGFSVEGNLNPSNPGYGFYASTGIQPDSDSPHTALLSPNTPSVGTQYQISMSVDASGSGTVSINGGPSIYVGDVGVGPFYILLGQRAGYPPSGGNNETEWFSASLTPPSSNACSATGFFDNFAADSSLDASCWSDTAQPLQNVANYVENSYPAQGTLGTPTLTFGGGGMDMSENGANPIFDGVVSTNAYAAPFQVQASVSTNLSADSAFVVYLVDASGEDSLESVEGNMSGTEYDGIWDLQDDLTQGGDNSYLGNQLIANPSLHAPYDITVSVSATDAATVSVNGVTDSEHSGIGSGPFYVILGQRATDSVADQGRLNGVDDATWYDASLTPTGTTVSASLSPSSPTVAGVETVPASAVPTGTVASGSSSSAGAASIQLGSIQLGSSQLGSIQLGSIPLGPIYSAGTASGAPVGLQQAAQALSSSLLSDIGISYPQGCGPTTTPCTNWAGILAGSTYANVPLESVTLADVLADTAPGSGGQLSPAAAFDSVNLASLDLSSSQLGSIQLGSIQLGSIQLGSIPLLGSAIGSSALQAWCSALEALSPPVPCSNFGITSNSTGVYSNPDNVTLLTLALAGVQLGSIQLGSIQLGSIQLGSIQLGSIQLGSIDLANNPIDQVPIGSIPTSTLNSTQLGSIQLGSIQLGSIQLGSIQLGSIPLSSIQLGSIPLGSIDLSAISAVSQVFNCAIVDCSSTSTETIGEAIAAGALLPGASLPIDDLPGSVLDSTTFAQLLAASPSALANMTLADLPESDYSSMTVSQLLTGDNTAYSGYPTLTLGDLLLTTVPPQSYPWPSVTLSSLPLAANASGGGDETYTASLDVSQGPATVQVSVSLPSSFAYVPGSTTLDGIAASDPSSGSSLTWSLPLTTGSHTLTFQVAAGIGLGPASLTMSASIGGTLVSTTSATADVVDGEEPAVNSPSTAPLITPGTPDSSPATQGNLNVGYLTSAGDLNDWAVNVPAGDELSLALSNFPASDQYDLELFGPSSQQLQGTPTQDLSGVNDNLPSVSPASTTEPTPGSQDLPMTPPAGDQLEAVSNNPAGQNQYIQTTPLAAGTYIVQVSGYNGAYSPQPYLLRANLLGGGGAPACPGVGATTPAISYLNSLGTAASGPVAIPSGVNTLFLVDTQRLTAAFGSSSEAQIMSNLQKLASGTGSGGLPGETGVNGAIVPVDSYASVQNAYAQWNSNPCSVSYANDVVSAIAAVVDEIRANNPTVQNVVVVGADDQIPFARIADGAEQSNERDYGAATFAGENNPEGDALSLGYYFSDDPYVSNQPLGVGSATLYTPQLGIGRLVESASEIDSALTRFMSSNGDLDATTSLTTGYSFLTSGAQAVSANLAANGITPESLTNKAVANALIGGNWQESDLDAALGNPTPSVISLNAHFDYSRALPAYDNTNGSTANLITTTDVSNPTSIGEPASSFGGSLVFSMGCHSGLDIDDAEVDASIGTTTPISDWAKTFADAGALWVANTGYGYADTDTLAYSAKLMAGFAADLNGSLTIGEALTAAKQQYAAGNAILSPYDLKALMESSLYGLPMYNLNSTTGTPAPVPSGPSTSPVTTFTGGPVAGTGITAAPVSLSGNTLPLSEVKTNSGNCPCYYDVAGAPLGGTQTTEYRPIEPEVSVPATESNLVPHGALVTGLTSTDYPNFTPTYSLPAVGSADSTAPVIGDAAFPGTLQRVATFGAFTSTGTTQGAQLDLVAGQFFPNTSSNGTGTQRLFTSMSAQVLYVAPGSTLANDYNPATIDSSQAVSSTSALNFQVQVTPSSANDPVVDVLVLYTDAASPGAWTAVPLTSTDGLNWSWSGTGTPSGHVQYMVEAVDDAGNVAVSNNEGSDFNGVAQPAVSITLSGGTVVNGDYTGAVTATVTTSAQGNSTYVLDGVAGPTTVPNGGTIVVTGVGRHILTVTGPAGGSATEEFTISTSQTTTTLSSSDLKAVVGESLGYTATVASASSNSTPGGTVAFFDNGSSTPISGCLAVALSGGTATCPVSYTSPGSHQITADYSGSGNFASSSTAISQTIYQAVSTATLSSSANPSVVGQPVTYTATVGVTSPGAGTPTGYVEFLDGAGAISSCGGATGEPLGSSETATCTVTYGSASPSSHNITATYLGDADFTGPTSSAVLVQGIGVASTKTTLTSSANPSLVGQVVTYTAGVSPVSPGAGSPTGSVTFTDNSTPMSCETTNGSPEANPVPLSGATASCTITYTSPSTSTNNINATYGGDGNFASSSASSPITQTVNPAPTTTTVTSSDLSAVVGETVVYTATVAGSGGGTIGGKVEFLDSNVAILACNGTSGETLGTNGTATCSIAYPSPGSHSITAEYIGTGNYAGSPTSSPISQGVSAAATSIKVKSSVNPAVVGQPVIYTATISVTSPGSGSPAGNVEFMDGSKAIQACNGTSGEPVTVSSETATCSVTYTSTSPSSHSITAVFVSSNANFSGSSSPALSEAVNKAATTITVSSPTNPSVVGQPVTYTAKISVTSPGAGSPTGYVEFLDGSTAISACSGTTGEPVTVGSETATCTVTYTSFSSHNISATYLTDGNFATSTTTTPVTQTVNAAGTSTSLSASATTVAPGQSVTFTAKVAVTSPGAGSPPGNVEFLDGSTPLCGGTTGEPITLSSETATCATSLTAAGLHQVTAKYLGDPNGNFTGSTSPALGVTVDNQTTTTVTSSLNPAAVNQTITYTAKVVTSSPGTGTPSGNVEFVDGTTAISACGGAAGKALSAGAATCTQSYSTAGAQNITAIYLGSTYSLGSTSPVMSEIVTQHGCSTLAGCNLQNLNLAGANLAGANLSGSNLSGANLSGANLAGANISGADLQNAILTNANLSGANLSGDNMQGANLTGANLANANLSGANLEDGILANANLSGTDLAGTDLQGSTLTGVTATGDNLEGDNLLSANLSDSTFTNASMQGDNLQSTNLSSSSFAGANLEGANLQSANLSNSNFSNTLMQGDDLKSDNLTDTNFTDANLSGANLSGSTLTGTIFTGANLSGTTL